MNKAKDRVRAHCPRCRHQQIFVRAEITHWLHLALSILTFGLWLVSWAALCIGKVLRPWRCEHCGWHKPEFRNRPPGEGDDPLASRRGRLKAEVVEAAEEEGSEARRVQS